MTLREYCKNIDFDTDSMFSFVLYNKNKETQSIVFFSADMEFGRMDIPGNNNYDVYQDNIIATIYEYFVDSDFKNFSSEIYEVKEENNNVTVSINGEVIYEVKNKEFKYKDVNKGQ